jgi:hypothetical protein
MKRTLHAGKSFTSFLIGSCCPPEEGGEHIGTSPRRSAMIRWPQVDATDALLAFQHRCCHYRPFRATATVARRSRRIDFEDTVP